MQTKKSLECYNSIKIVQISILNNFIPIYSNVSIFNGNKLKYILQGIIIIAEYLTLNKVDY